MSVELPVRYRTPDRWAELALADTLKLLDDHAHLERKAASNALELLNRWPDPEPPERWVQSLASVARDETDHLFSVARLLKQRGGRLSKMHRNPYAGDLRKLVRLGRGPEELVDRLLVSALIELRSCERFEILSRCCPDPGLSDFYRTLWGSEHGHYRLFLSLAQDLREPEVVEARWSQMLDCEADIIVRQSPGPRLHSALSEVP